MATISFGGLASGLDTENIVNQLMALEKRPRILLDNKQVLVETRQRLLKEFQTKLRSLQLAATDLRSVALYAQKQAVESSDPTKVAVSSTSGAPVGGYQIGVTQLANAAQRTFAFRTPAADGSLTIDGRTVNVTAGMTAQDLATSINTNRDLTVYAAALADGRIVLSNRETGETDPTRTIVVADGTGTLADTGVFKAGVDAQYTLDGVARTSRTNVITDAIPGVSVTLRSLTTTSGPVTVSVGAPGADTEAITRKVEAFVEAYNSTLDLIRSKLEERAVPDSRTQQEIRNGVPDSRTTLQKMAGTLFGDRQLSGMLSSMRQSIYTSVAGLPLSMDSLDDLGVSTGAVSTSTSRDTLAGRLVIDKDKLQRALTSDPAGVRNLLQGVDNRGGWARQFEAAIDSATKADGILDTRVKGADDEMKALKAQMAQMDTRLGLREKTLRAQFTALEVAMSRSQQQGNWLTGQLAGLS
jgi:flagellar hook-associated protein 2